MLKVKTRTILYGFKLILEFIEVASLPLSQSLYESTGNEQGIAVTRFLHGIEH